MEGRLLWSRQLGIATGASPALASEYVYVAVETSRLPDGFVVRLDRATGKVRWRSPRLGEQAHSSPTIDLERRGAARRSEQRAPHDPRPRQRPRAAPLRRARAHQGNRGARGGPLDLLLVVGAFRKVGLRRF